MQFFPGIIIIIAIHWRDEICSFPSSSWHAIFSRRDGFLHNKLDVMTDHEVTVGRNGAHPDNLSLT